MCTWFLKSYNIKQRACKFVNEKKDVAWDEEFTFAMFNVKPIII